MAPIKLLTNAQVKHLIKLRKDRSYRHSCQSVMIEGYKIIQEIKSPIKKLIIVKGNLIPKLSIDEVYVIDVQLFKRISGTQNPEGILAEIALPPSPILHGIKRLLVIERLNDPGNVGTLLRTALALGWQAVYMIDPCCDPYNDKALRAAKGATFHLSLMHGTWEDLQQRLIQEQLTLFAADLGGTSLETIQFPEKVALVMGNETHGISKEISYVAKKITIPMHENAESLNVAIAGAIIMYQINCCVRKCA